MDTTGKLGHLDESLSSYGGLVVAFSGGADSAFLLARAVTALGTGRVVAATAVSPSLPSVELDQAVSFAASLGVAHHLPLTDEMARAGYRANAGDRCYFCKAELMDTLRPLADSLGIGHVATGTNADDVRAGFRPGIRAAGERGAVTPLLDVGLSKAEIRAASKDAGLPTWDKPAAACLSSRVAYGIEITPARLSRVERAEVAARSWLQDNDLVVRDLRVRDLGDVARLEVDAALVPQLVRRTTEVCAALVGAGFERAEIDPIGFRSGAMNELLADAEAYR